MYTDDALGRSAPSEETARDGTNVIMYALRGACDDERRTTSDRNDDAK